MGYGSGYGIRFRTDQKAAESLDSQPREEREGPARKSCEHGDGNQTRCRIMMLNPVGRHGRHKAARPGMTRPPAFGLYGVKRGVRIARFLAEMLDSGMTVASPSRA